jgi:hypothetical protein
VSLWHACQLKDLRSYLELGGVPSRLRLERDGKPFTSFDTDPRDRSQGVWGKLFFNLEDRSRAFAAGRHALPNPYGPIVLQLAPGALGEATDVAVCLRSAGATGFDRIQEALTKAEEVDRAFVHPRGAGFPYSGYPRYGDTLQAAFPEKEARSLEISCTVGRAPRPGPGAMSFDRLVAVWVDPIAVAGSQLIDLVREALATAGLATPIHERWMESDRRIVLDDIIGVVSHGRVALRALPGRHGIAQQTRVWAGKLLDRELDWLWDRYSRYLLEGTLGPMGGDAQLPPGGDALSPIRIRPSPPSHSGPVHIAEVLDRLQE